MADKIWLSPPHMGGNELKYIHEAFDTNWIAPLGKNVDELENSIADYLSIGGVAALTSGTAAIHLALILLGVKEGDEVICSSFTFSATANPIRYQGAIPVFIDSEIETWNISPHLLNKAIEDRIKNGKKPKAIIFVHLYGMPAKIEEITEIANFYGIPLIEDAAEALGSKYKNKHLGTFGKFGILSFNGNKIITTSGGGALISNDVDLINKSRFLATQARDNAPHYQHSHLGYNYRMSNIVAGIGRGQMEVLGDRVYKKREIHQRYFNFLKNYKGIQLLEEPNNNYYSNYWLNTIIIDPHTSNTTAEKIRLHFESLNIESRPLWKPMHLQPIFEKYPQYVDGTSEELFNNGLCLPSGTNLTEADFQRIEAGLNDILQKKRIPFSPPRIDDKSIKTIVETIKSGWITTGEKTRLFEKKLKEYVGSSKVLCLNSATAGLELMLSWFGVSEGDEVILPAYTYSATANVILHRKAKPVFVDINSEDFNISVAEIKKAITNKTKVIMPVDIAGYPCSYNEINKLVNDSRVKCLFNPESENQNKLGRILVLADSAHGIGAEYNSKKIGSCTDIHIFSFHAVKNITTAEGGAISLNLQEPFDNENVYQYLSIISLHGQSIDARKKILENSWKYDIISPGYKYNMPDVLASIGIVELDRYEENLLRRKEIFSIYNEGFKDCNWAIIPKSKSSIKESSYHVYALRIDKITEEQRDAIIKKILEYEVSVNVHFMPVPMFSYYKKLGYDINDYPVSYKNYATEISLPVYFDLQNFQVLEVIEKVKKAVKEVINK